MILKPKFYACFILALLFALSSCNKDDVAKDDTLSPPTKEDKTEFWLGADISSTIEHESQGIFSYTKEGKRTENTLLMKELGLNAIRLRVWVNPYGGWCGKEYVLKMALRAKQQGMAVMLDFHYSDSWADPGKQNPPDVWKYYNVYEMKRALATHTEDVLSLLKSNGVEVKWVQVGNETGDGFLWEVGRASTNMANYALLSNAGYDAVKKIYPEAKVIVHIQDGFNNNLFNYILDGLKKYGGKWDIIGMSIYPYWAVTYGHEPSAEKTLTDCIANIKLVSKKYDCDVIIVETGVEVAKPEEGKKFLSDLMNTALTQTNGRCKGVFYWAPEWCFDHYPLGAFKDHKPTIIMDAFTEMAKTLNEN